MGIESNTLAVCEGLGDGAAPGLGKEKVEAVTSGYGQDFCQVCFHISVFR